MEKYDFSVLMEKIRQAEKIAVFTHIMPDGDALGSAFALRDTLRSMGKQADCFLEQELSELFHFFPKDYRTDKEGIDAYDLKISVDCGDQNRLGSFADIFTGNTVCMDHHRQTKPFAQVNITDEKSAAAGEIIYSFIRFAGVELTPQMADALYVAIATDTGGFLFSNTTARTHRIAAELLEAGADFYTLNKELLQEKTLKQYRLTALCIHRLQMDAEGKIAVTDLDYDTVRSLQIVSNDLDGLSALPRSIKGVEVGALLTELTPGNVKVSLRSDKLIDVSKIASLYGGGGHIRAAGFTWQGQLAALKQELIQKLKEELSSAT